MTAEREMKRKYSKGSEYGTVVGHFPHGCRLICRLSQVDGYEYYVTILGCWEVASIRGQVDLARYKAIKAAVARHWPELAVNEHILIDCDKDVWVRGYNANEVIALAHDSNDCRRVQWSDLGQARFEPRELGKAAAAFKALWGRDA